VSLEPLGEVELAFARRLVFSSRRLLQERLGLEQVVAHDLESVPGGEARSSAPFVVAFTRQRSTVGTNDERAVAVEVVAAELAQGHLLGRAVGCGLGFELRA
jgi:hypothetical protein